MRIHNLILLLIFFNSRSCAQDTLQFVPGVNPFINEACATTWDNTSAVWVDGQLLYWQNIPRWTPDPQDLDQDRFQFFFEVVHPQDTTQFTALGPGAYLLPVNDYGDAVCTGVQLLRIWVRDKVTGVRYTNTQIVNASFLCNEQDACSFGYDVFDVTYVDYSLNYQTTIIYQP